MQTIIRTRFPWPGGILPTEFQVVNAQQAAASHLVEVGEVTWVVQGFTWPESLLVLAEVSDGDPA
jgi:hypothetical protein